MSCKTICMDCRSSIEWCDCDEEIEVCDFCGSESNWVGMGDECWSYCSQGCGDIEGNTHNELRRDLLRAERSSLRSAHEN